MNASTPPSGGLSRRGFITGAVAVGGALAIGGILAACTPQTAGGGASTAPTGGPRTLTFWHTYTQDARVNFMRQVADKFEKAHPGVTVNIEVVPFPQYATKWPAAQAAGSLPDVTTLLPEVAVSMALAGALNPMEDVLDLVGGASAFTPGLLEKTGLYRDEQILIPHYVHNRLLARRSDLTAAAGVTLSDQPSWAEVLEAAQATTAAPSRYGWQLKLAPTDTGGGYLLNMMSVSAGGQLFDTKGKSLLKSSEVVKAAEFITKIGTTASGPGQANYLINDNFKLVTTGATALAEVTGADIGVASKDAPAVADTLRTSFMPTDKRPGHLLGAVSVALPKGKHPELAKEFAAFLFAEENYIPFLHTIPLFMFPSLEAANTDAFFDEPTIKKFQATAEQTIVGIHDGFAPGFEDGPNPYAGPLYASHEIEKALLSMINGTPVKDALATADIAVQSLFDDISSRL